MFPPSHEQYRTFLTLNEPYAFLLEFTLNGKLVAVAAFDQLEHGISAIYTFFDTDESLNKRSLGTFAVLKLIELARQKGLPHVYLGYWIAECRKMPDAAEGTYTVPTAKAAMLAARYAFR